MQATRQPRHVLEDCCASASARLSRSPISASGASASACLSRPHAGVGAATNHWYDTPNIHLCTIRDFVALCDEIGTRIEGSLILDRHGRPFALDPRGRLANLLAEQSVFVLSGVPRAEN